MGHSAIGVRLPNAFSSKVSVRWSDGSLSRLTWREAVDSAGGDAIDRAHRKPGTWIVIGQLSEAPNA